MSAKDEITKIGVMRSSSNSRQPPKQSTSRLSKLPDIKKTNPYFQIPEVLRHRTPLSQRKMKSNSTSIVFPN